MPPAIPAKQDRQSGGREGTACAARPRSGGGSHRGRGGMTQTFCLEMPMFDQGIPVCRKVYMSYLAGARPLFSLNAFQ